MQSEPSEAPPLKGGVRATGDDEATRADREAMLAAIDGANEHYIPIHMPEPTRTDSPTDAVKRCPCCGLEGAEREALPPSGEDRWRDEVSEILLNCPFCGAGDGDLMLTFTRADGDAAWWSVECCQCDAEVTNVESEAEAIIAWNRRTPPTNGQVSEPDSKEGE